MDRVAGMALWKQIADQIKGDISKNILIPGGKLPTEILLAQQFNVNRHTIRRSIAELVEEGLLKVEQGRGTFVVEHLVDYQLGRRTRFTETVRKQNKNPIAKTLSIATISADRDIAGSLNDLPIGRSLIHCSSMDILMPSNQCKKIDFCACGLLTSAFFQTVKIVFEWSN